MAEIIDPQTKTVGDVHKGVHNILESKVLHQAISEPGIMVLDAFATWCGPCKMIAPHIVKFSEAYPDVRFYKLDVDEFPEDSEKLGITAMPTIIVFKDGEPLETIVGANLPAIESAIKKGLE